MLFETAWASVVPRTEREIWEGHTGPVLDVCAFVSPSGATLLASAGGDGTVRVWDPAAGRQLHVLHGHSGAVTAVLALAGVLVSAGQDGTVRTWDRDSGSQLLVLSGYRGASRVEVRGQDLVACATDDGAALWDPATGRLRQFFPEADHAMTALQVEGRTLVAARCGKAGVGVWESATGEQLWQRHPDTHTTSAVCAVTVGGRTLVASAGYDKEMDNGRVRLWDPLTGEPESTIECGPLVERTLDRICDVRPLDLDGRPVLLGIGQKTVRVWDPAAGTLLHAFIAPSQWVESTCLLCLDGRLLLAISERYCGTIHLWDPTTGQLANSLVGERNPIEALCTFEQDGRPLLASADGTGRTVRVWDPRHTRPQVRHRGHTDEVFGIWPVGDRLISVAQQSMRLWNPATGTPLHRRRGYLFGIADVVELTVAGTPLLAGAFSVYDAGTIRLWDPTTGRQIRRLERRWEEGPSLLCPFTRDGTTLLAAGDEYDVRTWDPATGRLEQESPCGADTSWLGRIALDGRPAMVGRSRTHGLRIWDPAAAAWHPTPTGRHTADGDDVFAFMLHDRPLIGQAKKDGTIHIQDLLTGEPHCTLHGHTGYWIAGITTMTMDAHTYLLTSGGADRTVRLWDPDSGNCLLSIPVHHEALRAVPLADNLLAVAVPTGILAYRLLAPPREGSRL